MQKLMSKVGAMYAIVKAGGHEEKVEVGTKIVVNRLDAQKNATVKFPAVLVVDNGKVTTKADDLAKISVEGKVLDDAAKGKKIVIQKFHNKTGGARRAGHRQKLSVVEITKIA